MTLVDGREIRVVSPGMLNTDAGPDFAHASIVIDGNVWCGNVEVHVKASDWYRHGHDHDPAYAGVLLHVVAVDDARITRPDGSEVPQVVIALPDSLKQSYIWLRDGLDAVNCHRYVRMVSHIDRLSWTERLGIERMQQKAAHVSDILDWTGGDWQRTLFILLGRALGFGLNADPMEMLARALPLNFAARHSDNTVQIEAMLFGLAGMLDPDRHPHDDYYQYICREYRFLSAKYDLHQPRGLMWKLARTRPQNFPYRRIAMMAHALGGGFSMMREIIKSSESADTLRHLFDLSPSGYWSDRFTFGGTQMSSPVKTSVSSLNLLIINTAVPFLYCYGRLRGEEYLTQRAIRLLEELPPERNTPVMSWSDAGLRAGSAFESQALLHLKKVYCDRDRCLECRFGQLFARNYMFTCNNQP